MEALGFTGRSPMQKDNETLAEAKARAKKGARGKSAEKQVEDLLAELKAARADFDYDRLPDTRAAGRIMPARVSDFTVFRQGQAFSLEVKEIKSGCSLNIKSHFSQYPKMIRRGMAGCPGVLLVHLVEKGAWDWIDVSDIPEGAKSVGFAGACQTLKEALAEALESYE